MADYYYLYCLDHKEESGEIKSQEKLQAIAKAFPGIQAANLSLIEALRPFNTLDIRCLMKDILFELPVDVYSFLENHHECNLVIRSEYFPNPNYPDIPIKIK